MKGIAKLYFRLERRSLPGGALESKMVSVAPATASKETSFLFFRTPVKRGFPIGVFVSPLRRFKINPAPFDMSWLPYGSKCFDPNCIFLKSIDRMAEADRLKRKRKLKGNYAFYPKSSLVAFEKMVAVAEDYWRFFDRHRNRAAVLRQTRPSFFKRKAAGDRRGHACEKNALRDLAICFFYPAWAQQNLSLKDCHKVLVAFGIQSISNPDNLRRYIRRLGLSSLRTARQEFEAL